MLNFKEGVIKYKQRYLKIKQIFLTLYEYLKTQSQTKT